MARGYRWLDEIVSGSAIGVERIAARQKCRMHRVNMTISLAFRTGSRQSGGLRGALPEADNMRRRFRCALSSESLAAKQPRRNFPRRILPESRLKPTSVGEGRRRRRHIAQERIAAVTLDRGQVVRDQPTWPLDGDLDTVL
jgi:hypothetical protein